LLRQSQALQSHAQEVVLVLVLLMALLALAVAAQRRQQEPPIQAAAVVAACLLPATAVLVVQVWLSYQSQHPNTLARQLVRLRLRPAAPTQF
jgi:ABC-type arginine/histidine transport system permease subunit